MASSESVYMVVTDEVWENGRWGIATGWRSAQGMTKSPFTDLRETRTYHNFPKEPDAPDGWKWLSEWVIDRSRSFGEVDEEGWAYGTSFESLLAAIENKCTGGSSAGIKALVRRRRYVRTRGCINLKLYTTLQTRIEYLESTRTLIERAVTLQRENVVKIREFDSERHKVYEVAFQDAIEDAELIGKNTKDYIEKLMKTKAYLIERSTLEREYAAKLKNMSNKWMNAGNSGKQRSSKGFFTLVNTVSDEMSMKLDGFANVMLMSLCKDVDDMLVEVSVVASQCLTEAPKLRDGLQRKEVGVAYTVSCLQAEVDRFLQKCVHDIGEINKDILYIKNSGLLVRETFASSQPLVPVSGSYAGQSTSSMVAALSSASAASLAPVGYQRKAADGLQQPDPYGVYLAFQRYRRAIRDMKEYLNAVEMFSDSQIPVARRVSRKVSAMLQGFVRLFAREQALIWSGSQRLISDLEEEVKPAGKEKSVSSHADEGDESHVNEQEEAETASQEEAEEEAQDEEVTAADADLTDPDVKLTLPALTGVVKVGRVRVCLNPEMLLASSAATGVAVLDAPTVVLKDVLAVLFIDGMLYLYDPMSTLLPPLYNSDGSSVPDEDLAENLANFVNDVPIKCLNVGAISTFKTAVSETAALSSGKFDIQPLMCAHPSQEAFCITCPTLSFASQAPPVPSMQGGADASMRFAPMANVLTSPAGAAENVLQGWMDAVIDRFHSVPYLAQEDDDSVEIAPKAKIPSDYHLSVDGISLTDTSTNDSALEGGVETVSKEPTLTL